MGRLHQSPGQGLVPMLGVATPLAFAMPACLAADTATRGGKVPSRGKPPDIPRLEHHGEGQDLPNATHRESVRELRLPFDPLGHRLRHRGNVCFQTAHDREMTLHRQGQLGLREEPVAILHRALCDPVATQSTPRVTGEQGLETQSVRRFVLDQLAALAPEITDGPSCLRVHGAFREDPKTQQVGKPACIGVVIGILEPCLWLDGGRICNGLQSKRAGLAISAFSGPH